ncbi:MAG: transcription-repair coupling factor [Bdellovibrionales bacterium]|nr:transcription-repair coupling factor [Bdellovibrionales bacterium]
METDDFKTLFRSTTVGEQWTGLVGSSASAAIAFGVDDLSDPVLIVCHDEDAANTLKRDLKYFLSLNEGPQVSLFDFPARKTVRKFSQLEDVYVLGCRLGALYHLQQRTSQLVIVSTIEAVSQITLPRASMNHRMGLLEVGETYDRDQLIQELISAGYDQENTVIEPSSFAIRGSILDMYSPNYRRPLRIEFFDDQIESMRFFDPASQRSGEDIKEYIWIPSREVFLEPSLLSQLERRLKELCDHRNIPPRVRLEFLESLKEQRFTSARELLMPLFFEKTETIIDYLPANTKVIMVDPFSIRREIHELLDQFEKIETDQNRNQVLACPPSMHTISLKDVLSKLESLRYLEISDVLADDTKPSVKKFPIFTNQNLRQSVKFIKKGDNPLKAFQQALFDWRDQGLRCVIVAQSESGFTRLEGLLKPYLPDLLAKRQINFNDIFNNQNGVTLTLGSLGQGFVFPEGKIAIVTEADLFGERRIASKKGGEVASSIDLRELSPGDYIVHLDHGIGLYKGLERIKIGQNEGDFLLIEYADKDKLFLPVYRLNRVHKYVGGSATKVALDRLGNPQSWDKARERTKKAVQEMADELLALYAARQVATKKPYSLPDHGYLAFEEEFPYEETRDQLRTLEEVHHDLESDKPMDRLVCGDVGFGKTEIALRAAFRTAMEGMQVAVLVPTTILAQQHYQTFKERMKNHPISVDFMSRFKDSKALKRVGQQLREGKLDIVVGTHRLLSKDVQFKNLGLLVLDEEHRFGVKHKERIKQFRNQVNVMTLTATPIPRTLQLSMTGVRDLSVINTPPMDRKSVETVISVFDDEAVQLIIRKEISRGGQVFFVHNRVESIEAMATHLRKLVPEASVGVGHAQMDEKRLENTMFKFLTREFDVLVSTTIIESGLDISNANTMMINRADCFGLAQLYQLRGRVGRSDRHAYCYLLIPGENIIGKDALNRLKALKRFSELGSGLKIALHDLEMRGAGNLLGAQQSGHISEVGFELYSQLLDREIRMRKGEKVVDEIEPEIQTHTPAFLPEAYVPDSQERLLLYRRLSATKTFEDLDVLKQELRDRFGALPSPTENLIEVIELKILARNLGISSLKLAGDVPLIEFTDHAKVNIDKLLKMVKKDKRMKLRPDNRLSIEIPSNYNMIEETRKILSEISEPSNHRS